MNESKKRDPRFWRRWRKSGAVVSVRDIGDRQIAESRKATGVGAVVRKIDGQLVLDDPVAYSVILAVEKSNCCITLELNADRVEHFKHRMIERGMSASDTVIVFINVDDVNGAQIADALMPGYNWQEIRDNGEVPFARGLATKAGMPEMLGIFDKQAAEKLRDMSEVAIVVVDHGVAEIFPA